MPSSQCHILLMSFTFLLISAMPALCPRRSHPLISTRERYQFAKTTKEQLYRSQRHPLAWLPPHKGKYFPYFTQSYNLHVRSARDG